MYTKLIHIDTKALPLGTEKPGLNFVEKKVTLTKAGLAMTNQLLDKMQGPVLLVTHRNPDIDAWTATITIAQSLAEKELPIIIYTEQGSMPAYYKNILDSQHIAYKLISGSELKQTTITNLIFLDTGDISNNSRLIDDNLKEYLQTAQLAEVINIDHHEPTPPKDDKTELTVPHSLVGNSLLSAAGITLALSQENNHKLPLEVFVTATMLGIATDTQGFTVKNGPILKKALYDFAKANYTQTPLPSGPLELKNSWNTFQSKPTEENWDNYIDTLQTLSLQLSFSESDIAKGEMIMQNNIQKTQTPLDPQRDIVSIHIDPNIILGNSRIYIMDSIANIKNSVDHTHKNTSFVLLTFWDEKKKTHVLSFRNYNKGMLFDLKTAINDYFMQFAPIYNKVDLYGHPGAGGINLTPDQYAKIMTEWNKFAQQIKSTLDAQREQLAKDNAPETIKRVNALLGI